MMRFDENGKLVLPESVKGEREEEERSVILKKVQVSEQNPAVAQLRVSLGKKIIHDKELMNNLKEQCQKYAQYKQSECETKIEIRDNEIVIEAKSSWDMYSYLKELMMNLRNNTPHKTVVRGNWNS